MVEIKDEGWRVEVLEKPQKVGDLLMKGLCGSIKSWQTSLPEENLVILATKQAIPPLKRSTLLGKYFLKISLGAGFRRECVERVTRGGRNSTLERSRTDVIDERKTRAWRGKLK